MAEDETQDPSAAGSSKSNQAAPRPLESRTPRASGMPHLEANGPNGSSAVASLTRAAVQNVGWEYRPRPPPSDSMLAILGDDDIEERIRLLGDDEDKRTLSDTATVFNS